MEWMPLDTTRLLDSTLYDKAPGDAFKAAVGLWCKAWWQQPAASLPNDDQALAKMIGVSPQKWRTVKEWALHGFVLCTDGRFYHPIIAEKAREAWAFKIKQQEKANKRWGKAGDDLFATPGKPDPVVDATADANRPDSTLPNRTGVNTPFTRPEWVPDIAWQGFVEMRKRIKKPLTDYAAWLVVKELVKLVRAGEDVEAVLNQSSRNSWQDVYPASGRKGGNGRQAAVEANNRSVADRFAKGGGGS